MANRYSNQNRSSGRDNPTRRTPIPPERVQPVKAPRVYKSRFNIILISVVLILAYFGLEPFINKAPEATQQVISTNGENVVVDFPVISEVMTSNRNAYAAPDGEYYDWIELYNPTENSINLSGFALSDDYREPTKFIFPSVTLQPDEFIIVFATKGATTGGYDAPFGLSSSGETVYLADPYANIVDQVYVEHLSPNTSYIRNLASLGVWSETELFSPGFYNDEGGHNEFLATRRAYDSPLKINEVMSSNLITLTDEDGDYSDWVELINTGDTPLDISNYALSDSENTPRDWIFPEGTIINPGDYLIVFLSGKDKVGENGELHASFRLNSMDDTILCSNVQGLVLDIWQIVSPGDDVSVGLSPETGQRIYLPHPTPGYINNEDGYNQFQQSQAASTSSSGIIITEVMLGNDGILTDNYDLNPDWIEIYNNTDERISLAGYGLTDNSAQLGKWKFPTAATIEAKSYKIIYASGMDTPEDSSSSFLHTNFSLDLTGEPLVLTNPSGEIIDKCIITSMPYDISYGRPMGSMVFAYMLSPSPGEENGEGYSGFAPDPYIPLEGGVYADPQIVVINVPDGCTVRYTTDCSEPTDRSPVYQGPFEVTVTTVVRARAFKSDKLDSNITTKTYFIGVNHDLPIVSISTEPDNLYSDHAGILAFGTSFKKNRTFTGANFNQDWEVPAHLEMYEIDGSQVLNQDMGLRVFGAFSRVEISKSFALIARAQYGTETFAYPIFPDRPYTEYKTVILRNGASVWFGAKITDSLLTSLAADTTDLDVQAYYPVVYYLNGEYYGVYYFREKINKYYLQQKYGIDPENVDIIYGNGVSSSNALAGDNNNWLELRDFVKNHDLSIQENYEIVEAWVDVDNYMDMIINEIYVGNGDTGNIKCYREKTDTAKWRWFLYDLDWSFSDPTDNDIQDYLNDTGHGANKAFETWLIMGLLDNAEFREKFIERFAYHINVTYDPDRVLDRIDQMVQQIDLEMQTDRAVWDERVDEFNAKYPWYREIVGGRGMSYKTWLSSQIAKLQTYAQKRPEIIKQQLISYFDIPADKAASLFD